MVRLIKFVLLALLGFAAVSVAGQALAAVTVTNVTSSTADGNIRQNGVVSIQVTFSAAVYVTAPTVSDNPELSLNVTAAGRAATYTSGSGSSVLTFTFTAIAKDNSDDLDYTSTTALTKKGAGTIKDAGGNDAVLTLSAPGSVGSLGFNKNFVVDVVSGYPVSVTSTTPDGRYTVGAEISVQVNFSEAMWFKSGVTTAATSRLKLETGDIDRYATYVSGSGSSTFTFKYTVQSGDTSSDLNLFDRASLEGSLQDRVTNTANLGLPPLTVPASLAGSKAIVIDTTAPVVTSVTSSTADGIYRVGSVISLIVNFSEAVNITGTPQLTLETGATDRVINIDTVSGSGTTTLNFSYTVVAGDSALDLDYASTTSLVGTITDLATNAATLTLPAPGATGSLGANKAIWIDTTAPMVTSVTSVTADGAFKVGSVISLKVNFSEAVNVTGTPQLTLETGATDRAVNYVSGSGTSALTFNYTVQAGDTNADLDYAASSSLAMNGGTITDPAGNAGVLTLPAPGATGSLGANKVIGVDGLVPTITSVSVPTSGTYHLGQSFDVLVSVSEPVTVIGSPSTALMIGSTARFATYMSGSDSATLLFRYTVQTGDLDTDGIGVLALAANGATLQDAAGNALAVALSSDGSTLGVLVDGVVPTLTGLSPNAGSIVGGTTVTLTGSGFSGGSAVKFGAVSATSYTVESSTQITALAPNGALGAVNVTVTTPNGTSAASAGTQFTYFTVPDAPTIGTATGGDTQASVSFSTSASDGGAAIAGYSVTSSPEGIVATGNASPIVVTGLTNGVDYTFTVTATNAAGTGAASAVSNAVTPVASQTITFNDPGTQSFGASPTLTATATSGLAVSFTATTPEVCSVTPDGVLTFAAAGTCTIDADQAGDTRYTAALTVSHSFEVTAIAPDAPTIRAAEGGAGQASVSFSASASDGGAAIVGYSVTSSPEGIVATGNASPIVVTGLTNGVSYTFTVTATNAAGTGAASAVSNAVTPVASQTITFDDPGTQSFGASPTLTATATSGLAVSFTATTPEVCSVTPDGVLTFAAAGTCTIDADQAGDARYTAALTVSQTFAVTAVSPDAPAIGTVVAGDGQASVSFSAPAQDGGAEITGYTVTSSPDGISATGSVSPIVVTGLTNGVDYTFTVTATNAAGVGPSSDISNLVTPAAANSAPVAKAGKAQTVASGAVVTLDAMGSFDPDGAIQSCIWRQISGYSVALSNWGVAKPTFTAPQLKFGDKPITLVFSLTVYDGVMFSVADTVSITVQASVGTPATAFAVKQDAVRQTLANDATRGLTSAMSANQSLVQAAKGRLVAGVNQNVALDVDASFAATPINLSTMGTFFGQAAYSDGRRRLILGTFNVQRDDDSGASTATFNGKIAWEKMVSDSTLLGYFLGGDIAQSNIVGSFTGDQAHLGVSAGGYGVHKIADQIYLDGFVSFGAGRNDLTMSDDVLALGSEYTTRTATFGLALSGVIGAKRYEIWPDLALTVGRTWVDTVAFTGTAYGASDDSLSLDASMVTQARLTLIPELRIPLDGVAADKSLNLLTLAPRLICLQTSPTSTATTCGGGAEIGLQHHSTDGQTTAKARILSDWVDSRTSTSVQLSLVIAF